jgi:hypothetical protein
MAFQLTQMEYLRRLAVVLGPDWANQGLTLGEIIEKTTPKPKERDKLRAVFMVMKQLQDKGRWEQILRLRKLICWRSSDPQKFDLELEFDQQDPPRRFLEEAGLIGTSDGSKA